MPKPPKTKPSSKSIKILGIETSCDETAAAVVEDGKNILSNVKATQIDVFKKYGGVIPEVSSRLHIESIPQVVEKALKEANVTFEEIDYIAVTETPGLKPALLVGQTYASGLALGLGKKLIKVNHLFGHMYANFLTEKGSENRTPEFPLITLLVSGGHTQIIFSKNHQISKIIGETRDDSAGEAYDKVARMLGFEYPGGILIDKHSKDGIEDTFDFPRPMIDEDNYDFSFSGLKTSIRTHIEKNKPAETGNKILDKELKENFINDTSASFQEAVVDVLLAKILRAANELQVENIALAGGVAANSRLRAKISSSCRSYGFNLFCPSIELCTDNAAMIAGAAFHLL